MSKVMWLEEHRATRQSAIDNAVRLAQTEIRLKMEEELETKLESRLEEGGYQTCINSIKDGEKLF